MNDQDIHSDSPEPPQPKWIAYLQSLLDRVQPYLPSIRLGLNFSLLVKVELIIVSLTCIYLYFYRVHPYLVLTSKTVQEEQAYNREIATMLLKRYKEQLNSLESWWKDHVRPATELPQILEKLNPDPTSQMLGSLKIGEIINKEDYKEVTIDTQFQGEYAALLSWIKHIETLPFFLQVQSIDIRPHPKEELLKEQLPSPTLLAEVKLKAFLR